MRIAITVFLVSLLLACSDAKIIDLTASLKEEKLVHISYEAKGNQFECNSKSSQVALLNWSKTFNEPPIGSWADADEYLTLSFENGVKYRIRVTVGISSLDYSTIRMDRLYIGEPLSIDSICRT